MTITPPDPEPSHMDRPRPLISGKSLLVLSPLLLIIVVTGMCIWVISSTVGGVEGLFGGLLRSVGGIVNPTPAARTEEIALRLRSVILGAQLQTNSAELEYELIVEVRAGAGNASGYTARYLVSSMFESGIDLTLFEANAQSIRYDEGRNQWTISLPAPTLLDCQPRVLNTLEIYTSLLTPNTLKDEADRIAIYEALLHLRETIMSNDQQGRIARNEARQFFRDLLTPLVTGQGAAVEIEFVESGSNEWVDACNPQIPACFQPSESAGIWEWRC